MQSKRIHQKFSSLIGSLRVLSVVLLDDIIFRNKSAYIVSNWASNKAKVGQLCHSRPSQGRNGTYKFKTLKAGHTMPIEEWHASAKERFQWQWQWGHQGHYVGKSTSKGQSSPYNLFLERSSSRLTTGTKGPVLQISSGTLPVIVTVGSSSGRADVLAARPSQYVP